MLSIKQNSVCLHFLLNFVMMKAMMQLLQKQLPRVFLQQDIRFESNKHKHDKLRRYPLWGHRHLHLFYNLQKQTYATRHDSVRYKIIYYFFKSDI